MTTVDIEDLLRKLPPTAFSGTAQQAVDELFSKAAEPLTPEQRQRFIRAAERPLRVRREILTLAAFACGHRPNPRGPRDTCRECKERWPCPEVLRTAGPALEAVAELS